MIVTTGSFNLKKTHYICIIKQEQKIINFLLKIKLSIFLSNYKYVKTSLFVLFLFSINNNASMFSKVHNVEKHRRVN